jgi:serine/threonine-protein kinase
MDNNRQRQASRLYHAALLKDVPDRAAFVREACGGDDVLQREVESLLALDSSAQNFLNAPAAARLMADPHHESLIGRQLGVYRVESLVGAGGMGEVYRARDTRLGRDVAIKILPRVFTSDPERLVRFEREARVLASLNHQHIGAIYGVEEADGIPALVLELVEGPTLADRLQGGPLPVAEALTIAVQIAEALEGAHQQGIIHRDLKPANIKIREDGTVKVLDFGLAKALDPRSAAAEDTVTSPGPDVRATEAGLILGTAAYMSPEQARGRPVDKRTDIWAFGCVLFEMLTGRCAFMGEDVSDTLASVLKGEPNWTLFPADVPPVVRALVRKCLNKARAHRLADISTVLFVLDGSIDLAAPGVSGVVRSDARSPAWHHAARLLIALILGGVLTGAVAWFTTRPSAPHLSRLMVTPSPISAIAVSGINRDLAIAPDGTHIVYVGTGGTQMFVRAMDRLEPAPLTGLGNNPVVDPFFSPDGSWIGFFNGNLDLRKVGVTGGPPVTVSRLDGAQSRGATWAEDGTIVFATSGPTGLQKVSADGGTSMVLTTPNRERGEGDHLWPEFLPGGRALLFTITQAAGTTDDAQVAVLDLPTGTQKVLFRGGTHAHYVQSGHLVYAAAGSLRAVPFDPDRLQVGTTPPVPVLSQVATTGAGEAEFDISRTGTLVYLPGGVQTVARTLVWVDREGRQELIKAPARAYLYPRLSPDGTRVALDIRDQDNDIWIWNIGRETLTRFTVDPALDRFPVWMPDGRRLVFTSDRRGVSNLFLQAVDATETAERLLESAEVQVPMSVSPDGRRIVIRQGIAPTADLTTLNLEGDRGTEPLVTDAFFDDAGLISPGEGRWLAYNSNESGQLEIYVRPFPNVNAGHWQVSTAGGVQPLWARNGRELFYIAPTGDLMGVQVIDGPGWAATAPAKIIAANRYYHGGQGAAATYDVSPDGRRFLMIKPRDPQAETTPTSLIIVQNWTEELKRLVPTK